MDTGEKRNSLRQTISKVRNNLTDEQVLARSQKIAKRLLELEPVQKAKAVMGFYSIRNEVNLMPFMEQMKQAGKTVLFPRVIDSKLMEPVVYQSLDQMNPGFQGILEPRGAAFPTEDIDVVLVPGLVFDARGYRLGYGAGYYDRFLPKLKNNAFACGVCYEFQVVDNVYPHDQDIAVNWVLTDCSEVVIDWDYF